MFVFLSSDGSGIRRKRKKNNAATAIVTTIAMRLSIALKRFSKSGLLLQELVQCGDQVLLEGVPKECSKETGR